MKNPIAGMTYSSPGLEAARVYGGRAGAVRALRRRDAVRILMLNYEYPPLGMEFECGA